MNRERTRDVFQRYQGDVTFSALNCANVGAMNPTLFREILLRQTERLSETPHFTANKTADMRFF